MLTSGFLWLPLQARVGGGGRGQGRGREKEEALESRLRPRVPRVPAAVGLGRPSAQTEPTGEGGREGRE